MPALAARSHGTLGGRHGQASQSAGWLDTLRTPALFVGGPVTHHRGGARPGRVSLRVASVVRGGAEVLAASSTRVQLDRTARWRAAGRGDLKCRAHDPAPAGSPEAGEIHLVNPEGEAKGWKKRYTIVALCFFAFMLCNMDRVNMSIAILPMAKEYGWNSATVGLVQSSFFWGYLCTQILGGAWADKFGGKLVLGAGVVWWSVATMITPLAVKAGLPYLLVARAMMGIGEGVAMPSMNNVLSKWVPRTERSRSLAMVYSGQFLGSVAGLSLSPGMVSSFGWPSVFWSFGSLGFLWMAAWKLKAADSPNDDPSVSEAERSFITGNTSQKPVTSIPWKKLLSHRATWAIIICHFCHNWGTFILLTWMPTYYNQVLGLNLAQSGLYSVLPWICMTCTANIAGSLADRMVAGGWDVTSVRKIMQTIGFLGPAFFLTRLAHVSTVKGAVLCMMGSQGCDAFSHSGLYSNHQDVGPRYAGVLLGLSNTAGVLAGVVGTYATGIILQNGTWTDVFRVSMVLYLVGTLVWNLFATGEKVFD